MKKIHLFVYHKHLDTVIEKLHENGFMQIIHIGKNEPDLINETQPTSMHPEADTLITYELRLTRLIDILKKIQKKPSGIKALLHPQLPEIQPIEKKPLSALYQDIDTTLKDIEENILTHHKKAEQLQEKKNDLQQKIDQVSYLKKFSIPLEEITETPYTITKAGLTTDLQNLQKIVNQNGLITLASHQFGTRKKTQWAILLTSHISHKETLEKIARDFLSEFDLTDLQGTPAEAIKDLKNQQETIIHEQSSIKEELQNYADHHLNQLLALREQTQIQRIEKEIPKNFVKTQLTYVIQGWVIEKNVEPLKQQLSQLTNDHVAVDITTPLPNPDHPPTYIKTPWWAQGFRDLLEMFSTPKYNELNPTVIMGIFFVLFFGFMLGDAGYGSILLVLSLIGFLKFGKYSDMIRNWSFMGIWMGITSVIIGILTYSIFGNLIHLFFFNDPPAPIYSFTFLNITFPIDSLRDPLLILTAALVLGLVQLNTGLLLGMIQAVKQKLYKQLLTEHFCWVPLQLGGGLLIGRYILGWQLTQPLFYAAAGMVIIGLLLLFVASGPVGFFDITGYVGDWLSYARLLALGLATAGMALAFNIVSQLLGEMIPVVGIIVTVLLLIIMHLVNLALSTLGAAVHSLRLQYVEFFNRFYEGGGSTFSPFKITRKYTQLKEKKKEA